MSVVEKAVLNLANALDSLEASLDHRLDDHLASDEQRDAAKRNARAARAHTEDAAREIGGAIAEIKSLLDNHGSKVKG